MVTARVRAATTRSFKRFNAVFQSYSQVRYDCHNYASSLGRFFFLLSSCYPFRLLCTILRPQDMTPRIACDSKSLMTGRLGPLVRPRFSIRYLVDSRARPSPLWAYNTFSYVLFLSLSPYRLLFYSLRFHSIAPLTSFTSILFSSILFDPFLRYSLRFYASPEIPESHCI